MLQKKWFGGFIKDQDGATAIEFSIVALAFCLLFMAIIEFGLFMMTQVAIEQAVARGARVASIGTKNGCDRVCTVRAEIAARTRGLIRASAVVVTADTVSAGQGGAKQPDICVLPNGGQPNTTDPRCDCLGCSFMDLNGQPGYQSGGAANVGNQGDIIEVRASYPWKILFPLVGRAIAPNGVIAITSSTIVKNEQFE